MTDKPIYLDRIDELENVSIVRLKGAIDQHMIPLIDERIQVNRRKGSAIDKNVIVDYALVPKVDSSAIAFHLIRLKEYEARGFKIGFVNVSDELLAYLNMFHLCDAFKIYEDEESAVKDLNV